MWVQLRVLGLTAMFEPFVVLVVLVVD